MSLKRACQTVGTMVAGLHNMPVKLGRQHDHGRWLNNGCDEEQLVERVVPRHQGLKAFLVQP